MTALYREVMQITRAVVRRAERVSQQLVGRRQRPAVKLRQRLDITSGLVRRGLGQTRARIVCGNTHHPDKILSIFEPHIEVIRKGKAAKPTAFGNVVKIQEADGGIIT